MRGEGAARDALDDFGGTELRDCHYPGSPVACYTYLEGEGVVGEPGEAKLFDPRPGNFDRQAIFTELTVIAEVESVESCPAPAP